MFIDDHEFPHPHHPVTVDGDELVVDETVRVELFQLRPLNVDACAAWCRATPVLVNGGPALLVGKSVAGLGDYVAYRKGKFSVEPAAGIASRYRPAERET